MNSRLLMLLLLSFVFQSCKVGRMVWFNIPSIKDHRIFESHTISQGEELFCFTPSNRNELPYAIETQGKKEILQDIFKKTKTVAFLVIRNDSIINESYFKEYDEASIVASFSMSKSITSILIGCAIDDGLIQSIDEPITNYIPELKAQGFEKVHIEHLLQMTSGIKFNEGYFNPFGKVATYYYGKDLRKEILKLTLEKEPGTEFKYKSGNSQLLGVVLERALKNKTISAYLEEKLWLPMGMEYDASWSIDSEKSGLEKTFCCLNARAIDFAKIGRLYLNKGNWEGQQLVSEEWVAESTKRSNANGAANYYQYQWWLPYNNGSFMAEGILGQFIYVYPEKNLIIVRLGKKLGKTDWWAVLNSMAKYY